MNLLSGAGSDIQKAINPEPAITHKMEQLERVLSELNCFDEVKVLVGTPCAYLVYKKEGEDVLTLSVSRTDFSIKLPFSKWDATGFFQLPLEMEFSMEKTFSWELRNLRNVDQGILQDTLKKSIKDVTQVDYVLKYILMVVKAFTCKASFISESENQLVTRLMEHFWKGELNEISSLYENRVQPKGDRLKQFIGKWEEKWDFSVQIDPLRLAASMDVDRTELQNTIQILQSYAKQSCNKYIHSVKNLWFDTEWLQNHESFHENVEKIRGSILTANEFINDLESLLGEEENEDTSPMESHHHLWDLLIHKPVTDEVIPFLDKADVQKEDERMLVINTSKLEKLANDLANGSSSKVEYRNLLWVIFHKSQGKGFTVREIVRTLFIGKYDNDAERKDFELRYDVKRLFVRSTLENIFETMMEKLKDQNIIKEESTVIQARRQEKICFNYNIEIYDRLTPFSS
ncbi:hypothetical protein [Neobacillus sp. Marseille-QA0830]